MALFPVTAIINRIGGSSGVLQVVLMTVHFIHHVDRAGPFAGRRDMDRRPDIGAASAAAGVSEAPKDGLQLKKKP
jgi:hypothetical protein